MDNGRIAESIKKEYDRLSIASAKIKTCMSYIDFNSLGFVKKLALDPKSNIQSKIQKIFLTDTSIDSKRKIKDSIASIIDNETINGNLQVASHTPDGVRKIFEEELKRHNINKSSESVDTYKIARSISGDIQRELIRSIEEYISIIERIKELEAKQIENKKSDEQEKRPTVNTNNTYSSSVRYNGSISSETRQNAPEERIIYTGANREEQIASLMQDVRDRIANPFSNRYTLKEAEQIKSIYPDFQYGQYLNIKNLNRGIEIEKILNKEKLSANDMMDLAMNTYLVVSSELVYGSNTLKRNELFDMLDMRNTLEKYTRAYERFIKQYNSLSPSEKENIKAQITSSKEYVREFGNDIVTPEKLVNKINSKVRKELVEHYHTHFDFVNHDFYGKILHATRYMSIEEIEQLYKSLKKEELSGTIILNDEERDSKENAHIRNIEALQADMARVILTKINHSGFSSSDTSMMSEEAKKHDENLRIAAIIYEVFKEEPLQVRLKESGTKRELQEKGDIIIGTYDAKLTATKDKESTGKMVWGLDRITKTISDISKWPRYMMLMNKSELTKEEQTELKAMFK